jgi:hypothetical protein
LVILSQTSMIKIWDKNFHNQWYRFHNDWQLSLYLITDVSCILCMSILISKYEGNSAKIHL